MNTKNTDKELDLSRRGVLAKFGLAASLAVAAPVLMTMSTSAQANHKGKDQGCNGKGGENSDNDQAKENNACESEQPPVLF